MLTLYYAPDNASVVLRLALEEAGLAFETRLVDRKTKQQKSPEYLALNPAGLIPTLITADGPISETGACLLWLVDRHPEAGLGPLVHDPQRGAFLRWLFFLANTVHADLIRLFYPDRVVPKDAVGDHHDRMAAQLIRHLAVLDRAASEAPALFAAPSALCLYLGPLLRWAALYPTGGRRWLDLSDFPALLGLTRDLEARPSAAAAAAAEGLGDTPFTAPRPANPPEGSAL